jgi:hypothetical protein
MRGYPKKPYRIVTLNHSSEKFVNDLTAIGVKFTKRDVLNDFWGVEFTIEKPTGKGTYDKCRAIDKLIENPTGRV